MLSLISSVLGAMHTPLHPGEVALMGLLVFVPTVLLGLLAVYSSVATVPAVQRKLQPLLDRFPALQLPQFQYQPSTATSKTAELEMQTVGSARNA